MIEAPLSSKVFVAKHHLSGLADITNGGEDFPKDLPRCRRSQEQLEFWNALNGAAKLTDAQRELGRTMRGEA